MPAISTTVDAFYLTRLRRFTALVIAAQESDPGWQHDLARRAALSAYRDCCARGARADADVIVARAIRRLDRSAP
jgi:hypothetical protein